MFINCLMVKPESVLYLIKLCNAHITCFTETSGTYFVNIINQLITIQYGL